MDKIRALNPEDLENVTGGVNETPGNDNISRSEFDAAWKSLNLDQVYPDASEKERQYVIWCSTASSENALDFLMSLTK